MVVATRNLSVHEEQTRQQREWLALTVGLIVGALVCAALLMLPNGSLALALGLGALLCVAVIWVDPRIGLYVLLFCVIFLEQWGIVGLDPLTARFPFYQTVAATTGFPLPLSPVEIMLLLTLTAVVLRRVARRERAFILGPLFLPLLLFLTFVVASVAYGFARGGGAGPFNLGAAWQETRSFFYLAVTYVLACNLLQTRAQLRTFIWVLIAAIGLKTAQGIVRFAYVRSNGLQVDAITGHEDVVFFAAFVLLLAGLILFGARLEPPARWQRGIMLVVLPPLVLTLLVTNRRIGILVLAAGLALLALLLLRTRRDLFLRLAPVVLISVGIYTALFWNGTGTVSQPIRAVRSLIAPATERDRSSNAWRELENLNISYNIRTAPITGLGFGRPYSFIVAQPPLDATGFTYWRYIAHNAIYWVWMKMGLIGFILFWNLVGSAVVLALVTFRQLRDGYLRALALTVAGVVLMQVIFSYADLGLTYSRSMIFLGCMLGVLARLPALADSAAPEGGLAQNKPLALSGANGSEKGKEFASDSYPPTRWRGARVGVAPAGGRQE
jgi:O-Antigen ligase